MRAGHGCGGGVAVLLGAMRCVYSQQQLLEERCPSLWHTLSDLMAEVKSQLETSDMPG